MSPADAVKQLVAKVLSGPEKPRRKWKPRRSLRPGGPGAFKVNPDAPLFSQIRQHLR